VSDRPWSSPAPVGEFQPYVPAEQSWRNFRCGGAAWRLFGLLFGAVTVYGELRGADGIGVDPDFGDCPSALRAFSFDDSGKQHSADDGSAGESLAAGRGVALPALIFLASAPTSPSGGFFPDCASRRLAGRSLHGSHRR